MKLHRPHPKSWFRRKSKVVTVPEAVALATVAVADLTSTGVPDPTNKRTFREWLLRKRASHDKTVRDGNNAIDDAYKMYAKALKAADREYTENIQPINAVFFAALHSLGRNSPELNVARKKYEADKAGIQAVMDRAISAAGAVLDVEIKHQHDLMEEVE